MSSTGPESPVPAAQTTYACRYGHHAACSATTVHRENGFTTDQPCACWCHAEEHPR
jgi:hypothetical protein